MDLRAIEDSLPNGLHDAHLERMDINYKEREAFLDVYVWIGDLDSSDKLERERYRRARISLAGLLFISIQPPNYEYRVDKGDGLRIDSGPGIAPRSSFKFEVPLPDDAFLNWIYVTEWNAFIHIAAKEAMLEWVDTPK
jgi:hypothetical protein